MPKQTLELEVPEGWELTGEYRAPKPGDYFINSRGRVFDYCSTQLTTPKPIVRRVWQWPEWLKAGWTAMDKNGIWWAYTEKPRVSGNGWTSPGIGIYEVINSQLLDFTPPPCDGWRQSLRKNPHLGD